MNKKIILNITYRFVITYSKLFAFFILILSFIISYKLKETSVIIAGIAASAALVVNKQYQDRLKKPKENGEPE